MWMVDAAVSNVYIFFPVNSCVSVGTKCFIPEHKYTLSLTAASFLHGSVDVRMSSLLCRSFAHETLSPCCVLTTSSAIIAPPGASDKESSF